MLPETFKTVAYPDVFVTHDEKDTGLLIEVALPGVEKKDIELNVGSHGFCVKGERDDLRYDACYKLGHEVKGEKSKAVFENGLLKINVPFKDTIHGTKIKIN